MSAELLGRVPEESSVWLAADLDVASMARQLDLQRALETVAEESGDEAFAQRLASPFIQAPITAFGRAVQRVLTFARGEVLFAATPGDATGQPAALYLPLRDRDGELAAEALGVVRAQLELFALTGLIKVQSASIPDGGGSMTAVTVSGPLVEPFLPGGLHFALTTDNVLVLAASENAAALAALWPEGDATGLQSGSTQRCRMRRTDSCTRRSSHPRRRRMPRWCWAGGSRANRCIWMRCCKRGDRRRMRRLIAARSASIAR